MLPPRVKDLTNRVFGRLTVVRFVRLDNHKAIWLCRCTCGGKRESVGTVLLRGANKSCGCHIYNRKPPGEAAFGDLYRRYKYDAQGKDREFSIPKNVFRTLVTSCCNYCGSSPSKRTTYKEAYNGQFTYNGLDRVDNTRGYSQENVVPCCETCNKAKRAMGREEFLSWIQKVYNHNFQ